MESRLTMKRFDQNNNLVHSENAQIDSFNEQDLFHDLFNYLKPHLSKVNKLEFMVINCECDDGKHTITLEARA